MIFGTLLYLFVCLMFYLSIGPGLDRNDRRLYAKYAAPGQVVDERTFNLVSQLGHFAGGLACAWGSYTFWGQHGALWSLLVLAALVGVKEFWWDNKYESAEVRGSNLLDWSMWMAGSAVANLAVWFRLRY
jgi:hypothetical protein